MRKVIFISILIIFLITCGFTYSQAADTSIWEQAKDWIKLGQEKNDGNQMNYTGWSQLAGVLWGAGIWISIISGAILGIRFMIVAPEHKAQVKEAFMAWLIGTVIVVGALSIWNVMINLVDIFE